MQISESADGQEVALPPGQSVNVSLVERPTTGFRWHLISDGQPACRQDGESTQLDTQAPGGGVTRTFRFAAVEPGLGIIQLVHRRAWENAAPARTFTLRVRVSLIT